MSMGESGPTAEVGDAFDEVNAQGCKNIVTSFSEYRPACVRWPRGAAIRESMSDSCRRLSGYAQMFAPRRAMRPWHESRVLAPNPNHAEAISTRQRKHVEATGLRARAETHDESTTVRGAEVPPGAGSAAKRTRLRDITAWLMWFVILMPLRAAVTLIETVDGSFSWADQSESESSSSSSCVQHKHSSRSASRKTHLQAEMRRQKYEQGNAPPPASQQEWLTKCKEEFAASEAASDPAGTPIFQLNLSLSRWRLWQY